MRFSPAALVTAAFLSSVFAAPVAGQQPSAGRSATGSLVGVVTASSTRLPVGADVTIDHPRRGARADSSGRFVFRNVPVGRVHVRVVAFGYEPGDTTVTIRGGDTVSVTFW